MELRVLRYFMMVVKKQNITHAAEALHISQPTISRQLKNLEDELGVDLFVRDGRAMELTSAGDYFANQTKQILALADKTVLNVQKTAEINGNVVIGSAEVPMMNNVVRAIKQLRASAPKVIANIYSADADDVYRNLQAGIYDFGVVMEPADKVNYNFLKLPGSTAWGVLTRHDSRLGHKEAINAQDLRHQELIMPRQQSNANVLADWLGTSDVELNVIATYNLLYNASIMVAGGAGSALGLDGIINLADSDLIFVPLTPRLEAKTSLIWPKSVQLSTPANAFLTSIKSILPNQRLLRR